MLRKLANATAFAWLILTGTQCIAQPVFGPTAFTFTPNQPTAGTVVQVTIASSVACPFVLDSTSTNVTGNVIEITGFFTCGTIPGSGPYSFSVSIGALAQGTYTIQHTRRVRFNPAPAPYGSAIPGGSVQLAVTASAASAEAIPAVGAYATGIMTLLLAVIALAALRQRGQRRGSTRSVLVILCAPAFLATTPFACNSASAQSAHEIAARQLAVLLDPRLTPASAEEIVAELTNRNVALLEFFGNPAATKKLITDTTSPDRKADFSRAPMSPRALLDQFVILTFDTTRQAEQAYEKLKANTLVLAIERNGVGSFSVTPSDCYFGDPHAPPCQSTPAGHENYQWGLNKLEFPRAWDRVRGQAYVAAIDSGVPWTSQSTHPDLQRSLRPLFSYNVIPGYSVTDLDDNFFGGKGHGTHVLGIIAATPEYATSTSLFVGNTNSGVAGGCWNCSVAMIKFGGFVNQYADTIAKAVDRGMQVVNMSWGDDNLNASTIPPAFTSCAASDYQSACLAIAYAVERDVVLVGAAGNKLRNRIQFRAQHSSVVSVGGIEADSSFWDVALVEPLAEPGSNYGSGLTIAAPAKEILSTVYPSANWSTDAHCGDSYGPPIASSIGYGGCTGTSMSAPHITALLGLIRSADPLLNRTESKNILTRSATKCTGSNSDRCGPGFPDAVKAVADALGGPAVINRVTPLFSFYSSIAKNHFYTSVPQMALAALISGGLLPQPSSGSAVQYGQIGLSIPGYPSFPNAFSPAPPATAIASIFTTHRNPISGQSDLAPLYRLSFRCGDQTEPLPACTPGHVTYNAAHISHFYETDANGVKTMTGKDVNGLKLTGYPNGAGYQLDGIEGFVYPRTQTQPPGTVKLCRKYDATRDDWVLFPGVGSGGTDCSSTSDGYTGGDYSDAIPGADWLGWVYHVKGSATVCINNVSCRAVAFLPLILDD